MKRSQFIFNPASIWDDSYFVFDTNVLLKPFRIDETQRSELINIFSEIQKKEKLWIPNQVGKEFYKHNDNIKKNNIKQFKELSDLTETTLNTFTKALESKKEEKQNIDLNLDKIKEKINVCLTEIQNELSFQENNLTDYDSITKDIEKIFDNVGPEYDIAKLFKLEEKAKLRYEKQIPPGYKDDKKNDNKYGDAISWFQIMDFAKENNTNIILTTNDNKEDWFEKDGKLTVGPRKELLREFELETGKKIYIYSLKQFIIEYKKKVSGMKNPTAVNNNGVVQLVHAVGADTGTINFMAGKAKHIAYLNNKSKLESFETNEDISELIDEYFGNFDEKDMLTAMIEEDKRSAEKHIQEMKNWFLDFYENPAESTPYDTHEGGYQYSNGPYNAEEELINEYAGLYKEAEIKKAAEELESENGTLEWVKK